MGLKVNPRFNEILADALERQKAEQETEHIAESSKKDTISRQAAIDAIVNTVSRSGLYDNSEVARYGATFRQHEIIDIIESLPPAQPETVCVDKITLSDEQIQEAVEKVKNEALQVFPSAQPEQTDCEFCHEDSNGYVYPIEKNSHAVIYGSVLHLKAKGWSGKVQIKYCPICGRRLTDG